MGSVSASSVSIFKMYKWKHAVSGNEYKTSGLWKLCAHIPTVICAHWLLNDFQRLVISFYCLWSAVFQRLTFIACDQRFVGVVKCTVCELSQRKLSEYTICEQVSEHKILLPCGNKHTVSAKLELENLVVVAVSALICTEKRKWENNEIFDLWVHTEYEWPFQELHCFKPTQGRGEQQVNMLGFCHGWQIHASHILTLAIMLQAG